MKLVKENQFGINSACIRNKGVMKHLAHKTRRYIDNIYCAHKNETGLQGLRGYNRLYQWDLFEIV